ncbi:cellulose synthase catalytic subunit (UDP-forming) (plasmid) [Rhizobium rosettiformans]|uniref:Cellulose synthase catalytic subunit [UDP-forming] n=1 Tax=Rhizobium rosettiformans TaxID=1368430 RepID=A0ABX7F212_9HYPH|nr:UDP-forming cellulose synthase catalytic subunit [Rhizobium rosettiformans]QRF54569.1 cellulose synthase catalytic subunit (UDP-forming) [Rhizobium rosettiformans]
MMCAALPAIIAGLFGVFLLWLPISLQAQLVLSLAILALMLLFMMRPQNKTFRVMTFVFSAVLALRYAFWRTTETLPDINEPWNFIPGIILYAAEMYCLVMLAINFFIVADPLQRKPAAQLADEDKPTVDVFVPSYNESADLLALTLAAAKSMDYPADKLTVYLLDDGGTDAKCRQSDPRAALAARRRREELQALSAALGVRYHARAENSHAKAGNLNAGLAISTSELVVVFDADHAPVREFLNETVGHFRNDEKLFLVQTPHYFLNPDPVEKNLQTFGKMPSENEMFYSVVQRGLDKWNASFFCGSAAVLRRKALKETGGFSGQSITEDCESALALHCRGWHSLYVDKPLIAGLQPETLVSFIGQRVRWAQGMLQILTLNRPFLQRGLSAAQRICYAGTNLFWLFPLTRLTFMFSPLLYIFFSLQIFEANITEFICYSVTYLISSFAMQSYLFGRVRWPWVSELYEYVQSVMLFGAILSVVKNPRKPTFNVTSKGQTLDESKLSPLARPYFVIFFLLFAATCYAIWRYTTEAMPSELLLIVAGWNIINMGIAGAALGSVSERRERRRNQRLSVRRHAILHSGGTSHAVIIADVSSGGLALQFIDGHPVSGLETGEEATIEIRRHGRGMRVPLVCRSMLRRQDETSFGFAFAERTPETFIAIAEMMYCEQQPLQERWNRVQKHKGFFTGTFRFALWTIIETLRGFTYALRLVRETTEISHPDAPLIINTSSSVSEPGATYPAAVKGPAYA